MIAGFRFRLLVLSCILAGCLVGAAGAASLGNDWKERAPEEGPYLGVMITPDASLVYAGGNVMFVRSWDRQIYWGYRTSRTAAMSDDAQRIVMAVGNKISIVDNKGVENWTRNMDGYVTSVAISPNGSFIISADNKGNYNSWGKDGELVARLKNQSATAIAYAPYGDLVVAATEGGLRFYTRKLELIWYDNRTFGRDAFIAISADGSNVVTAGDKEVASYTRDGTLNWRLEMTKEPIIDMKCSADCSAIFVAGQDKEIVAIDRYGKIRWKYKTGEWVNALGVSRDASVIAAGGNDRTVTILSRSGSLITKKKIDAIIQPRSIAVSSDGRRIVVSDQANLYGFSIVGDAVAPDVPETYTIAPLNPVPTTNPTTYSTTRPVTTEPAAVTTETAVPSTSVPRTTYTPLSPLLLLPALCAAVMLLRRRH